MDLLLNFSGGEMSGSGSDEVGRFNIVKGRGRNREIRREREERR